MKLRIMQLLGDLDQAREITYGNVVEGNIVMNGDNDYTYWIVRLYKARPINL